MTHADPERYREWRREWRARNRDAILAQDRVRKRSYGRPCLDCGKITDGSNGRAKAPLRCAACTALAARTWTREAIIAAIQCFAERYGHKPSASDFNPSQARQLGHPNRAARFHADGDYPLVFTVRERFGTWNAAIEAAGFTPHKAGQYDRQRVRA